ncbi:phosphate ABC transporter permease subunit PstC [Suttonella ornithocola]|uniref:Phosphate transport system permease protein n=1 Tax=Suttonella ornithocola TaxID=279832 RepID=A0A380MXY0_9GAMM|nr:phosphate ABC transporter permease subunit PstC [Suttonella ornithocola]SUO97142.1 Phosphate transport system permease protein pstC [Suttonella ornithocola]
MNTLSQQILKHRRIDYFFVGFTRFFAFLVLMSLLGITISLIIDAWPAMKTFGLKFLVSSEWDVNNDDFGALTAIFGTVATSAMAIFIAVPVSFGIAVFLTELCPLWLRRPIGIAVELLAGIPSIVYGIWRLFVFAPWFSETILRPLSLGIVGVGFFTAGLILSIMIIPFIASVMRDVFETVPKMLKESAYGLGATRWEVLRNVVFPYTSTGIVGGIILGLGRALGETMAVTFVIGNVWNISFNPFHAGQSITSALANEFNEADGLQISSLMFLAVILMLISLIVLSLSKMLLIRGAKHKR